MISTPFRVGQSGPNEDVKKPFTKHDGAKPPLALLATFEKELGEVAHILSHGAEKYGMDNWKQCDDPSRYHSAAMRHMLSYANGEKVDKDSGKNHAAHAICSLLFSMYLEKGE